MKLKNKLLISGGVSIALITAGAMTVKGYVLDRYNEALVETKVIQSVNSNLMYKNGDIFIESDAVDFDNFKWKVLSKVALSNDDNSSLALTTKVFATEPDTEAKYSAWLNARNSSLNMIADSVVSVDRLHVDIRTQPTRFDSGTGIINVPELAIIYDSEENKNPELVVAALGVLEVRNNSTGGSALFTEPRIKYSDIGDNKYIYSLKIGKVSVGSLVISKETLVDLSLQAKHKGMFDLNAEIQSDTLGGLHSLTAKTNITNVTINHAVDLLPVLTSEFGVSNDIKTKNLSNLFDYAKQGGKISFNATAKTLKNTPLNIAANLSFEDIGREFITPNNAFSILDYAILNADIELPLNLASDYIGPQWTANLIRDGIFLLIEDQVKSEVKVRKMTAQINGSTYTL